MTSDLLSVYAEIEAIRAEIFGMLALNTQREQNGWSLKYHESDFKAKARELRSLARGLTGKNKKATKKAKAKGRKK